MLKYLNETSDFADESTADDDRRRRNEMSELIQREVNYLREVKTSRVVESCKNFAKLSNGENEFVVTVIPHDEIQKHFAEQVKKNPSDTSVYYDAECEIPNDTCKSSMHEMLNSIFALTISKLEDES